ncbi:biotin/lipoyl-binding protein [Jannaschia rubra]|uniref:biotin/lipoyl-binding protein n=1 Tax=Jannaschia rubra TaxID=282197 RepID=UPI00248FB3A6|nr:biotin/lipoyl-binding protein [Jannaschia rubra]
MSDTDTAPPERSDAPPPARNPARAVALVVVALLILLAVVYALSDRLAPSSSRGIVSAHVVQIAPRVSGEVTRVAVEDDAFVEAGDVLFTLDPRPFDLAVQQAEANLAQAT